MECNTYLASEASSLIFQNISRVFIIMHITVQRPCVPITYKICLILYGTFRQLGKLASLANYKTFSRSKQT